MVSHKGADYGLIVTIQQQNLFLVNYLHTEINVEVTTEKMATNEIAGICCTINAGSCRKAQTFLFFQHLVLLL